MKKYPKLNSYLESKEYKEYSTNLEHTKQHVLAKRKKKGIAEEGHFGVSYE